MLSWLVLISQWPTASTAKEPNREIDKVSKIRIFLSRMAK